MATYTYSPKFRFVEITAMLAMIPVLGLMLGRSVSAAHHLRGGWIVFFVTAVVGYLGVDFISGMVHWLADRCGTITTPIFGQNFLKTFRDHHTDQLGITRHDFIEVNGLNSIVSVPNLALTYMLIGVPNKLWQLYAMSQMFFWGLFVYFTNQCHKWAHSPNPPMLAKVLQRLHVIISPEHHQVHHKSPYLLHYCITTGWMNRFLDGIRWWAFLEACVWWLRGSGRRPRTPDEIWPYEQDRIDELTVIRRAAERLS